MTSFIENHNKEVYYNLYNKQVNIKHSHFDIKRKFYS